MKHKSLAFWDRLGISISAICAAHCLVFPLLVAVLPLWPLNRTLHAWAHPVFFAFIVPTVFFAIRKGKGNIHTTTMLITGVILLAVAWIMHDLIGTTGELVITLTGSMLLIMGHVKNYNMHVLRRSKSNDILIHE